jgi:hypothetical protein
MRDSHSRPESKSSGMRSSLRASSHSTGRPRRWGFLAAPPGTSSKAITKDPVSRQPSLTACSEHRSFHRSFGPLFLPMSTTRLPDYMVTTSCNCADLPLVCHTNAVICERNWLHDSPRQAHDLIVVRAPSWPLLLTGGPSEARRAVPRPSRIRVPVARLRLNMKSIMAEDVRPLSDALCPQFATRSSTKTS